jgi:hypothetical protein
MMNLIDRIESLMDYGFLNLDNEEAENMRNDFTVILDDVKKLQEQAAEIEQYKASINSLGELVKDKDLWLEKMFKRTDEQAAEIERLKEENEELLTQKQHTQALRDQELKTLNKTQCEVHKMANLYHAEQFKNESQAAEIAELTTVKESLTVQVDDLLLEVTGLNKEIDDWRCADNWVLWWNERPRP